MHRDVINFVVVTRCVPSHNTKVGLTLRMLQHGLHHYDVGRRSLEALEKTGNGNRVRQALSRAHVAHRWRFSKRGWGAVCQRVGGRECKSFRCRQFRCVCYIANAPPHILNCSNLERHDQHDQTRIHAESLLLGTSERPSAGHPRRVCARSWYCCGDAHNTLAQSRILELFDCMMAVEMESHWRPWRSYIDSPSI